MRKKGYQENLLYKGLAYKAVGCFYNVYNELGPGYKESVYHKGLLFEFDIQKVPYEEEKRVAIKYKGTNVGYYIPDFVVDKKIIVEIKAVDIMPKLYETQLYYYLSGEIMESIFSFGNIYRCYLKCRRNKRNTMNALKFELKAEENMLRLEKGLKSKTYHPSRSVLFFAKKPKLREIFAADFRDRIVHHILVGYLEPRNSSGSNENTELYQESL